MRTNIYSYKGDDTMRIPALPKDRPESKRTKYIELLKEKLSKLKRKRSFVKVPERK